ncbi:MAG: SagB/ThcOx family dehydrogenase [Synergistetes bacterium]|nr:SagB/ThcOx family dehydrogenase [Synergistota bacterium]MCX8128379.1 SagB/ThcOx family dehydrogenase [Synergistota bacterium]MDW8192963.1 SagB/ThcOx family dehydrogenase [Synergistota bacterium]
MLKDLLLKRRSVRSFVKKTVSRELFDYLLWVSYGKVDGRLVVPSGGATYPIQIYAVLGDVEGLEPGVYRYINLENKVSLHLKGDVMRDLSRACLNQRYVADASFNIVIAVYYPRITSVYGERGKRYAILEAGHIGQNIYLACAEKDLGTVAIGAFNDEAVSRVLALPQDIAPLYIFPIGYPAR